MEAHQFWLVDQLIKNQFQILFSYHGKQKEEIKESIKQERNQ